MRENLSFSSLVPIAADPESCGQPGDRGKRAPRLWKSRCQFSDAWVPALGPEPAGLAWHCCALVGTAGPRPLRGSGGGGAELAAAVGTDSSGRKT